ncbi:MAG: hypothetical protein RLZZ519_3295, partial [Bacteroidota bacterium]
MACRGTDGLFLFLGRHGEAFGVLTFASRRPAAGSAFGRRPSLHHCRRFITAITSKLPTLQGLYFLEEPRGGGDAAAGLDF